MSMNSHAKHDPKKEGWGKSLTKQEMESDTNINNIIARFTKTGQLTHISASLGAYRDLSGTPDLHEAMTIVADANSLFHELPAEIRKICKHDAANFLPFIDDPANLDQCIELKLLEAPKGYQTPEQREANNVPSTPEVPAVPPITGGE